MMAMAMAACVVARCVGGEPRPTCNFVVRTYVRVHVHVRCFVFVIYLLASRWFRFGGNTNTYLYYGLISTASFRLKTGIVDSGRGTRGHL